MINKSQLQKELLDKLDSKNPMELPSLEKVVIGCGVGQAVSDKKFLEEAVRTLAIISGQKPIVTRAKKAVSGFKIRQGDEIGVKVTLRGKRMYDFIEKFASLALPRIRDFKGLSPKRFDSCGNYTMPLREQVVFPEIPYDSIGHIHGLQITFKINNTDIDKSKILLETLGMPFERNKEVNNG